MIMGCVCVYGEEGCFVPGENAFAWALETNIRIQRRLWRRGHKTHPTESCLVEMPKHHDVGDVCEGGFFETLNFKSSSFCLILVLLYN